MNVKTTVGVVLMVGFAALLFLNFGQQVGGYMTFEEAEAARAEAHVVGTWAKSEPTRYDRAQNLFVFHMQDENGNVREVHYADPKPANFEEAEQIVVQGRTEPGGTFTASHILVKCPSKYNDAKGLESAQARAAS